MPDATYVGAGMPCGNCGNPLTPGQPHKCGRTPDQPRDDGTHGTRWLAGKLPPDKEVVLAHHYDALRAAASPDERLREAAAHARPLLAVLLEASKSVRHLDPPGYGEADEIHAEAEAALADLAAALAAADREKPDEKVRAMTLPDGEAYCPPVSDDPVNDPETNT